MKSWIGPVAAGACVLAVAIAGSALLSGQKADEPWGGVLDEHPRIAYASRPTTDRVAALSQALAAGSRSLRREPQSGYLASVLDALGVPVESQLLVFSKTGVQRAHTGPHTPRAIFYNLSVVVAHVPGAPFLELAAQDPQQGVVFYTLDQTAASPALKARRPSCVPAPAFRRQSGADTNRVVALFQGGCLGEFGLGFLQGEFGCVLLYLQLANGDQKVVGTLPRGLGEGRIGEMVGVGDPRLLFFDGDLAFQFLRHPFKLGHHHL